MVGGRVPACGVDPPGVPGVACRRGTCGCPGIRSEPRSRTPSISCAREPVARGHVAFTFGEDGGAPATRPGWVVQLVFCFS
jgi:hypothetical protein